MIAGIPKETFPGESRVAMVPGAVAMMGKAGFEVLVERGAGQAAGFLDADYEEKGAKLASRDEVFARADVICQVRGLGANPDAGTDDLDKFKSGQALVAMFEPLTATDQVKALAERGVTGFALELIPRITRAQSMDVLSSQATIAGYKAVLIAANEQAKMFPMMMTAAGTISPAHVFVIGAGVAGLQAIASAKRMGAVVEAYDVRPEVAEQIESLGGKFVKFDLESASGEGGYAKEQSEDFIKRQREQMAEVLARNDVVITTAAVPGKKAPVLITAEMVESMTAGSVIVDLAAERGGNCELTRVNERVTTDNGVLILGPGNLPATVPFHASQMFARNVATFLKNMAGDETLQIDGDDEIVRDTMMCRGGEVVNNRIREALGLPVIEPPKSDAEQAAEDAADDSQIPLEPAGGQIGEPEKRETESEGQ